MQEIKKVLFRCLITLNFPELPGIWNYPLFVKIIYFFIWPPQIIWMELSKATSHNSEHFNTITVETAGFFSEMKRASKQHNNLNAQLQQPLVLLSYNKKIYYYGYKNW